MIENLVSIIMPSYNTEKYIFESIESVIAQTYKNWELLIIDDCSEDLTIQIIQKYLKVYPNIFLIQLEKNSGAAVSRNKGIEKANGEYIAFLDSDDLWEENKLEIQINFMKENNCAFSFTEYMEIDEMGNDLGILIKVPVKAITYRSYLLTNPIGCLTAVYSVKKNRKSIYAFNQKKTRCSIMVKNLKYRKKSLSYQGKFS